MAQWNRRRFISTAAVAAGGGLAGWHVFGSRGCSRRRQIAGCRTKFSIPWRSAVRRPSRSSAAAGPETHVCAAGRCRRVSPGRQPGHEAHCRPADTGDVHELATFTGNTGAAVPRHAHLSSHAAVLVMRGEDRVRARGRSLDHDARRFREPAAGDAARVDDAIRRRTVALFSMNHRVGAAFTAMGERQEGPQLPTACRLRFLPRPWRARLPPAIFSSRPPPRPRGARPGHEQAAAAGAWRLRAADGGGERFGGTPSSRATRTQPVSSCSSSPRGHGGGVGAHFHARHFENFFGLDGETLGWAYGKAVRSAWATISRRRRATCMASG